MNCRLFIVIFVLLALLSLQEEAAAKCAFVDYAITGSVVDELTEAPITNATLFFFFDEYESTLAEGNETKYPDYFTSDGKWDFVASAFFDTFSNSGIFGDRCDNKPNTLMVIVTASGYLTKRVVFHVKDLSIVGDSLDYSIKLPSIRLVQSKP